jgi:hypothetical protein
MRLSLGLEDLQDPAIPFGKRVGSTSESPDDANQLRGWPRPIQASIGSIEFAAVGCLRLVLRPWEQVTPRPRF